MFLCSERIEHNNYWAQHRAIREEQFGQKIAIDASANHKRIIKSPACLCFEEQYSERRLDVPKHIQCLF